MLRRSIKIILTIDLLMQARVKSAGLTRRPFLFVRLQERARVLHGVNSPL